MLTALTTGLRFRLAILIAIFASLCFVAPPAVMAMGHGKNTLHCLANLGAVNHGMNNGEGDHHGHQPSVPDGKSASHADPFVQDAHKMTCCGLFCLSAVEVVAEQTVNPDRGHTYFTSLADSLLNRSPELLDRPPISLLSL